MRRRRQAGEHTSRRRARILIALVLTAAATVGPAYLPIASWREQAAALEELEELPVVEKITLTECELSENCKEGSPVEATPQGMFVDARASKRQLVAVENQGTPGRKARAFIVDLDTLQQEGPPIDLTAALSPPAPSDANFTNTAFAYDTRRARVLFGSSSDGGAPLDPSCGTLPTLTPDGVNTYAECRRQPRRITAVDVDGPAPGSRSASLKLPVEHAGEFIANVVYDHALDKIFVLTYSVTVSQVPSGTGVVRRTNVHRIRISATGSLAHEGAWPVPQCHRPLMGGGRPPFLGVSAAGDYVFFACEGISPLAGPGVALGSSDFAVQAASHGVVRLSISSNDPVVEFFPFSGNLDQGFSFGDQLNDRLGVIATSASDQRLYVFDGRHRAWTGSVPLGSGSVVAATVDELSGRMYVFEPGTATLSDAAPLPITQGARVPVGVEMNQSRPVTDPSTRRIFILGNHAGPHIRVLDDHTPPYIPEPPVNPDAETHDIDEALASNVDYTGAASAYGARARMVGGPGGAPLVSVTRSPLTEDLWAEAPGEIQQLRPQRNDEGLVLADIPASQLSGEATASAASASLDESSRSGLEGLYGLALGQVFRDPEAQPDAAECDGGSPTQDCLAFDAVAGSVAALHPAACKDFGNPEDVREDEAGEAGVSCAHSDEVTAHASGPEVTAALPIRIGRTETTLRAWRDPERGIMTRVTAVAQAIEASAPGLGALHIGEVRSIADTQAKGRPGSAESTFATSVNDVRISDADGTTQFACGLEGADDPEGNCDPAVVVQAINRFLAMRVQASAPRQNLDESVTGSPGGARAIVEKDPYAFVSDREINGDSRKEIAGLTLTFYNDGADASRLVVQLAAVYAESQYTIGAPAPEVEPLGPAKLVVELLDDLGGPLAGGMFEVHEDPTGGVAPPPPPPPEGEGDASGEGDANAEGEGDASGEGEGEGDASGEGDANAEGEGDASGEGDANAEDETTEFVDDLLGGAVEIGDLIDNGVCVTGDDGIGNCTFEDIEPGAYVVLQTAAPAGYGLAADPFPVLVSEGFETKVTFTNLRSIASIQITLTDDANPPTPLAGGDFVAYSDGGDLVLSDADKEVSRCLTGADGTCGFDEVALGSYVVHQSVAPNGLMTADDVGFSLDQPGQVASLTFVNGLPPIEGSPPAVEAMAPPPSGSSVTIIQPPAPAQPSVQRVPIRTGGGIFGLPADAARFIARNPGQAALIAGVWLLFAMPAYLAARRRSLVLLKEMT